VCDNDQIEGGSFDCSADIAWQQLWCNDCEYEWIDTYSLCDVQTRTYGEDEGEPDMATARELRAVLQDCITDTGAYCFSAPTIEKLKQRIDYINKVAREVLTQGLNEAERSVP